MDTNRNDIKQSGVRVDLFLPLFEFEIEFDPSDENYTGQRYWVVGCIGSAGSGENAFLFLNPVSSIFFNNNPVKEVGSPSYCA